MATHYIGLYATSVNPEILKIIDDEGHISGTKTDDENLTSEVLNGDTIIWKKLNFDDNAIQSIDRIVINSNGFFSPGPTPNGDGTWSAIVNDNSDPSMYGDGFSEYTIFYTAAGKSYNQDPKIRLRPTLGDS